MSSIQPLWDENYPMTSKLSGRILDAGCGAGHYTLRLRAMPGVTEVVPLDILPATANVIGERFVDVVGEDPLYMQGNLEDLPNLNIGHFDGIFCWRVWQYLRYPIAVATYFEERLRRGGLAMIRAPRSGFLYTEAPRRSYEQELAVGRADAFSWRTFYDEEDMRRLFTAYGFVVQAGPYTDRSDSQVWLFRKITQ